MKLPGTLDAEEATAVLRAAARELLPVVIEMGPERARFSSFVSSIETDIGGEYAVLEPVADQVSPVDGEPFRIASAAGSNLSLIATQLERRGTARARIALSHVRMAAPETTPNRASVPVLASDLLVLVVPGGLHGSSAYVFPVQRIGAEICEIRSSVAFMPGQDLPCVELVGDRRLLRTAAAQVLDTVPYYQPDGSRSFACRLSLSEAPIDQREHLHDLVTDPAEVRRMVDLAGLMQVDGWYEAPGWGRGVLRFAAVSQDEALLDVASWPSGPLDKHHHNLRIGVELFAISYELDVRVLAVDGERIRTSLPLILRRRRRHRRDHRIPVTPEQRVEISFRNPVTGAVETHALSEVSFFGVTFECELGSAVLWRGLPLEQAQLSWNRRLVHLGDVLVERYRRDERSGALQCTASIPNGLIADDPDMIALLATLAHPQVRQHEGDDFSALHATYLKAGLFGPHMSRNLAPLLEQTKSVWRRLHAQASDVVRTFIHGPEGAPDAAVTIMRAWEHAWVLQHFVDTSPELSGATGKLQHAYLDHLVPRPDGRYLVFFVKTDNRIMNAYLRRFFASTGTPDAVTRTTVELWMRPGEARSSGTGEGTLDVTRCVAGDELLVARAAQRCFGAHSAAALSMVPGELPLPDTQQRFARAGLSRERDCSIVRRGADPLYAVIEERATPGMNLTWMLNASWILPVHRELDHDGAGFETALRSIVERPAQSATGDRFLNLPEGLDGERLARWGFTREATLYLYVLTRAGLHRFFHYAAHRYGELDARAEVRERRRIRDRGKV